MPATTSLEHRPSARGWRWGEGVLCLGLLAMASSAILSAQATDPRSAVGEDQVKAVFLYNFARFVEWPAPTPAEASRPLVLGLMGRVPFRRDLEEALKQAPTVSGRRLVVREVASASEAAECQILFIAAGERARVGEVLGRLRGRATLTVSDMEQFCESGGMIRLRKKADTLGTEVNVEAAESAGLRISAKLLRLSTIVHSAAR